MDLITKIEISPLEHKLKYQNKILFIGSCFSENIEKIMSDYRFNTFSNPFGVLYNPCSIANSISRLVNLKEFTINDVVKSSGIYTSFFHHSSIYGNTPGEFINRANSELLEYSNRLKSCDTIIITLGTAWIYKHIKREVIVSNCHKIKASEFERNLLSLSECKYELSKIINLLPDKNIIFTVSPIRHLKDSANGNQISKSTLLLAINEIIKESSTSKDISYFPAYEIMMDELRDYRFYSRDMVHPSEVAIEYIFGRFKETFIDEEAYALMKEGLRLTKALNHKPLFPDSNEYQKFKSKTLVDLEKFNDKIAH